MHTCNKLRVDLLWFGKPSHIWMGRVVVITNMFMRVVLKRHQYRSYPHHVLSLSSFHNILRNEAITEQPITAPTNVFGEHPSILVIIFFRKNPAFITELPSTRLFHAVPVLYAFSSRFLSKRIFRALGSCTPKIACSVLDNFCANSWCLRWAMSELVPTYTPLYHAIHQPQ